MHSSRLPFLFLLLVLAGAAASAQPFAISEPVSTELLVRDAKVASDGNEFLTVWEEADSGWLYATPLDRFGAEKAPATLVVPERFTPRAFVGESRSIFLMWSDSRYILVIHTPLPSGSRLDVIELDRLGNVTGRWNPVDLGYVMDFKGAFWTTGSLQITFSRDTSSMTVAEIHPDGELRIVGDFPGTPDHAVAAPQGGWYVIDFRPFQVGHYSRALEKKWEMPVGRSNLGVDFSSFILALTEEGSLLFGWRQRDEVTLEWSLHFARASEESGVTLGAIVPSSCVPNRFRPVGSSGSLVTVVIDGCSGYTTMVIDARTATIVDSRVIEYDKPLSFVAAADAEGGVLGLASHDATPKGWYRLAAFLLSGEGELHRPARLSPTVPSVSVDSSEGRTTAAWIERSPTRDRLLVRRVVPGGGGSWLMIDDLVSGSGAVQLASSPYVDLVLWRSGDQLYAKRFDHEAHWIDDQPLALGTASWDLPPAAAWNGSHFLVVWGQRPTGGSRSLTGALIEERGGVDPIGMLEIPRPPGPPALLAYESPSLAWNGREFLLTFHASWSGWCSIPCGPSPRSLFVLRLGARGSILDDYPLHITEARVPPTRTGGPNAISDVWPSAVASDGEEFVIAHAAVAGPQLIRVETHRGPEVSSVETLLPWGQEPGRISIAAGSSGYAVATTNPTDSGSWLVLDSLDSAGNRPSRAAHPIRGAAHIDVASTFGGPLAVGGGVLDDGPLAFAATPSGAVSMPSASAAPEPRMTSTGYLLNVQWEPVEGANGYIVTIYYAYPPESYYPAATRSWISSESTRKFISGSSESRVTVQAVGPAGASSEAEAVFIPYHRKRIVGR